MSTTTDRVTLILDCLGHEDTELDGQPRLWRHRDGRYITEDEAAMVAECTRGDVRAAMALWHEELEHMQEQNHLRREYLALVAGCGPDELVADYAARLPEPLAAEETTMTHSRIVTIAAVVIVVAVNLAAVVIVIAAAIILAVR